MLYIKQVVDQTLSLQYIHSLYFICLSNRFPFTLPLSSLCKLPHPTLSCTFTLFSLICPPFLLPYSPPPFFSNTLLSNLPLPSPLSSLTCRLTLSLSLSLSSCQQSCLPGQWATLGSWPTALLITAPASDPSTGGSTELTRPSLSLSKTRSTR